METSITTTATPQPLAVRRQRLASQRQQRAAARLARVTATSPIASVFAALSSQLADVEDIGAFAPWVPIVQALADGDLPRTMLKCLAAIGWMGAMMGKIAPNRASEETMTLLEDTEGQRAWLRHVQCVVIPQALGEPPIPYDTESPAVPLQLTDSNTVDGEVIQCVQ